MSGTKSSNIEFEELKRLAKSLYETLTKDFGVLTLRDAVALARAVCEAGWVSPPEVPRG